MTGSAIGSGPIVPLLASAQEVTELEVADPATGVTQLNAITLYGDRTTTDIDEATASVAVVGAEALSQPTVMNYDDAYRQMANVSTGDWTESGFVIRGVNSEGLTPGGLGAPLASFYIDGVQQTVEGSRRGLRGSFDLEQIEAYRGPQSTLTGCAALAGAIYVRTKDPEFSRSGAAQLTYGSDNHKQVGLAFGDALGDRLAYRISGEYSEKDSDLNYPSYKQYDRYDDYVKDDYWTIRGKLFWLPTEDDNTRIRLSYSRSFDGPTQSDVAGPNWSSNAPGEVLTVDGAFKQKLMSQEIRLNYDNGPLRWVAGAYAAKEEQNSFRDQVLFSVDHTRNSADITNYALFGEVNYEFAPGLRAIAGARLDKITQDQTAFASSDGVVTSNTRSEFSDTVFIAKIGLQYEFDNSQSVSVTYQEGYRPGGSDIYVADGSVYSFNPESTRSFELSWRGRFMDDRLRVAANIFHQKWEDQHIKIRRDPVDYRTSYITKAGKSESYGGEVEFAYEATSMLDLTASVGLLHTEFKEFVVGDSDYSGLEFAGAPRANLSIGAASGGDTGWFASGNLRVQSSMLSRLESNAPLELGGFGTVDVAAGYAWSTAKVTANATNLFDREYLTYEYGPGALATLGDRREVGLRLDYSF